MDFPVVAAAVDIAAMPVDVDPAEPSPVFERVRALRGVRWPLEEFSHEQFMRDRDHAGWLERTLAMRVPSHRRRVRARDAKGRFVP